MKKIERTIFSLIIARLDGYKISQQDYVEYIKKLVKKGIGGFVLYGGDYESIKEFLESINSLSEKPLIIASDIERGVGQQIKGATIIPSQMGIVAGFDLEKDKEELKILYSIVINEALQTGINLPLIPVLDVNTEKNNPIICTRAFSDDPFLVSQFGRFVIKLFKNHGLATCGKHFPGHGSTKIDSHIELPTITGNIDIHLLPFREVIKEKVPTIMVGHLLISDIDNNPATLSEKIIQDILRNELKFRGIIITDAMNMQALKDYPTPHTSALLAGADIILHPEEPHKALEEIVNAYKKGLIKEKRIKEALERVEKFRKNLTRKTCINNPIRNKDSLIQKFFKKSITVINNEIDQYEFRKITPYLTGSYTEEIKKIFENYFGYTFDLKDYKPSKSIPLIAVFTSIKAAGIEYGINTEQKAMIETITSKSDSFLVSFGNPYIIKNLLIKKRKTIVLVYDSNEFAVQAFLESLKEGLKHSGRTPIKIE